MKPKVSFQQTVDQYRKKTNLATLNGVRIEKSVRLKPRNESEKMALCHAVMYTINEAKRSGKLKKTDRGYALSWRD